jgi:hypothetical protein
MSDVEQEWDGGTRFVAAINELVAQRRRRLPKPPANSIPEKHNLTELRTRALGARASEPDADGWPAPLERADLLS